MKNLSKSDVLDLVTFYKLCRPSQEKEVIDGVFKYLDLKFDQHTRELRAEVLLNRAVKDDGQEALQD